MTNNNTIASMELIRQRDGKSPMEDRKRPYPLSKFKGNGTERKCGKCGRSVATIDLCDRGHSYCDSCWHEYEGLFGWYEATEWYAETPCPECVREDFGGGEVLRLTNPQEDLL